MFIKQSSIFEAAFSLSHIFDDIMNKIRAVVLCIGIIACVPAVCCMAQAVPLDSCRMWALRHNKSLQVADETVRQTSYMRRAARSAYLPAIDFFGAYFYNQKPTRLIDIDLLRDKVTSWGVPADWVKALLPDDFMQLDTHQVAGGVLTLTQPVFMGGKIIALNDMANLGEQLALSQRRMAEQEVVAVVDDAYWLVVSLVYKQQLAQSYVALVEKLQHDMMLMIEQGIATRSEALAVDVAKNEADVMRLKVDNGLMLARMALAQLCGMPIDTVFELQDAGAHMYERNRLSSYMMSGVYERREEMHTLYILSRMAHVNQRLALSSMLPSVALLGIYSFGTPNLYNGFKTSLDGMFSVGVVLHIPIFHWGRDFYRYKASRSAVAIANIEIDMAKERIELQVNEARCRYNEMCSMYEMCVKNGEQAQLNLDNAQYAFDEGVFTYTQLMAAQTAWRQAQSELIDAHVATAMAYDNYVRAVGLPLY